jgi:hypothetical protein
VEALEGRRHTVPCDGAHLHSLDTRVVQPHIVAFYRGKGRRGNRALLLRFAGTGARSIPHFFPGYGGLAARFRWRPNLTTTPGNCKRCPEAIEGRGIGLQRPLRFAGTGERSIPLFPPVMAV